MTSQLMIFFDISFQLPTTFDSSVSAMRWKVIILVSAAAAILGCLLWCVLAIAVFGSVSGLARHNLIFAISLLLPLGLITFASIFVYLHTALKRMTQAVITALLSLFLTPAVYLTATFIMPARLHIPRVGEPRPGS